ncbi:MAG: tetratricopeptide repeat protein [Candidatus Omnitrophica bacterium]|nr:tetratricopeptide repeat protein [Candidatus Omnitrophota bacterium]
MTEPIAKTSCFTVFAAVLVSAGVVGAQFIGPQTAARPHSTEAAPVGPIPYMGSSSCRECHEGFYQKWATSHHGLAMQPYTDELASKELTPPTGEIEILGARYLVEINKGEGWVLERDPSGEKKYPIAHAMGGKNVYYFLTPLERGRLQVLPLAFDVRHKRWIDTTGSAVRHFGDQRDEPLDWRDPALTFNTSCHSCHVSQLSTNYDLETDTYHTEWTEPGINCETCHGSAVEHVKLFRSLPKEESPSDIRILSTRKFSVEQMNALCAPCHAKMAPLSSSFPPGSPFFDHFDLITLEDDDFHPDGRDLGENYTLTSWLMSPCVKSGELSCMHCHTSSGRMRFTGSESNNLCLPCHEERVRNATEHTHHPADSPGNLCISCHMPSTDFARMRRSDHSMRPPMPSASMAFGSPNACNLCHSDKDAAWADKLVREWRTRDYQAPVLQLGHWISAARQDDWKQLPEMLAYLGNEDRDEIFANSLVRLLRGCEDPRKWPAVLNALQDRSPLIRGSAAESLQGYLTQTSVRALLDATRDPVRLVRVRAAASLAGIPEDRLQDSDRESLSRATKEYLDILHARSDDSLSHYNLGNHHARKGEFERAIECYETALRFQPDSIPPMVNASIAYNQIGANDKAEAILRRALAEDPTNSAANLNLGLLLGELGRLSEAERAFRAAFASDPKSAVAAYNLAVLVSSDRPDEAISWCETARTLAPDEPKYTVTLAFYFRRNGQIAQAISTLRGATAASVPYPDAYTLLGQILEEAGQHGEAAEVYRAAIANDQLPSEVRSMFRVRLESMKGP